jgi:hypothetical protein
MGKNTRLRYPRDNSAKAQVRDRLFAKARPAPAAALSGTSRRAKRSSRHRHRVNPLAEAGCALVA